LNTLVAVGKAMQAVKLCTNKILQFLTGGAANAVDLYLGGCCCVKYAGSKLA